MITVNLLAPERKVARKGLRIQPGHRVTLGCMVVLLGAALFVGWRHLALKADSARVEADIAGAQQETARLHAIIAQVQQFEQRRAQLQQRVTLIEQLRREQTGPVHLLDQISRALPPLIWLTELKQTSTANEVLIEGRCMSLTNLSDFVGNLEASGYFKKSVEIVSTQVEARSGAAPGELIKFQIKAIFERPAEPKAIESPAAAAADKVTPRVPPLKPGGGALDTAG
jgi:type IV pilus assembly protein PilN